MLLAIASLVATHPCTKQNNDCNLDIVILKQVAIHIAISILQLESYLLQLHQLMVVAHY